MTNNACVIPQCGPFGNTTKGPRTVIVPADPIIWSDETSYEYLTLVASTDFGQSYISKRDVPAGTPLTDTDYWIPAAMFNAQLAAISNTIEEINSDISQINGNINTITTNMVVTPEAFGAVGDGKTDDSEAFEQALKTGRYVLCNGSKTYYFAKTVDCSDLTYFYLDGGGCTFINFAMRVNVVESDSGFTWNFPYATSRSFIKNVYFRGNQPSLPIAYTGSPITFENVMGRNVATSLVSIPKNIYMDYMQFRNLSFYNSFNGINMCSGWDGISSFSGTEGISQGDEWLFDSIHLAENVGEAPALILKSSGKIIITNCLNIGLKLYNAFAYVRNCHLERCNVTVNDASKIFFEGCEFSWTIDMSEFEGKNCEFTNCLLFNTAHSDMIGVNPSAYNYSPALGSPKYINCIGKQFDNTGDGTTTPALSLITNVAPEIVNFSRQTITNNITYTVNTPSNPSNMTAGTRHYKIIPSVIPTLNVGVVITGDYEFDVNVSAGQTVTFNLPFNNVYCRVNVTVNGATYQAVTYVLNNRIIDNGTNLNCVRWITGSDFGSPATVNATRQNKVLFVSDGANSINSNLIVGNTSTNNLGLSNVD